MSKPVFTRKSILFVLFCANLALNSCKEDIPEIIKDDPSEIIISKDVVVIDDQTWKECFLKIDSTNYNLTFSDKSEAINKIVEGNIIVSGIGNGLMRRVKSIKKSNGQLFFNTSPTVLTEVITQGDIEYEQALIQEQISSIQINDKEIVSYKSKLKSTNSKYNLNINFPDLWLQDNKVKLSGAFNCNLNLDANIEIGLSGLEEVKLGFNVNEELGLYFQSLNALSNSDTYPREDTVMTIHFNSKTIWVGYVPLVFKPTLYLKIGYEGQSDRPFTSGFEQSFAYNAGIQWYNGAWDRYGTSTNNQTFIGPNSNNVPNANLKAYIKPEIEVMINNLVGPYAFLKLFGRIEGVNMVSANQRKYTIYKGMSLGAGVRVNVLSWNWQYEVDNILSYEDACLQNVTAFPNTPIPVETPPTVTNINLESLSPNRASVSWEIPMLGTRPLIARGICWGTQDNPTLNDNNISLEGMEAGTFINEMINLTPDTKYFVRAYVHRASYSTTSGPNTTSHPNQMFYSSAISFKTPSRTFVDTRDNHTYNVKDIGNQTWMAENLAYLPEVNPSAHNSSTLPRHYVLDFEGENVRNAKVMPNYKKYGVLYNYPAALTACPAGWHLPTDSEWKTLEMFLGMSQADANNINNRESGGVGRKLKSTYGWDHGNGDNISGFTAIPSGNCIPEGGFEYNSANFWTSTPYTINAAWSRSFSIDGDFVTRNIVMKNLGSSIRCIEN
jgi:uncharacterized protein (TIGR02145 family)